jgi:hypothetical protein
MNPTITAKSRDSLGRVCLALSLCAIVSSLAVAFWSPAAVGDLTPSIPSRAVKVAGARNGGNSWGLWLFGRKGRGCWGTRTRFHGQLAGESVTCGLSVPADRYQLVATGTLPGRPPKGILMFLVRSPEVHRLKVFTSTGSGAPRWAVIATHPVRPDRHPAAEVPKGIGSAVAVVNGRAVCPRRVVALNDHHEVIARGSLPPCGEP